MTIDLITANPDTGNPSAFNTQADLAWNQLKAAILQFNTAITAFNFNATNSTSTTSLSISIASKSLTVQASKSYVEGQSVTIARTSDETKWMRGEVTSYDSGTGALIVNVRNMSAVGGTFTDWTISQAAVEALVNYSAFIAHTGNGHGSTNTKIRRLTTVLLNTGTGYTYADSATNGMSLTINEPMLGQAFYADNYSGGLTTSGVSKNSSQLTTAIQTIAVADILGYKTFTASNDFTLSVTPTTKFNVGDIVRMHDSGTPDSTSSTCYFGFIKVANI